MNSRTELGISAGAQGADSAAPGSPGGPAQEAKAASRCLSTRPPEETQNQDLRTSSFNRGRAPGKDKGFVKMGLRPFEMRRQNG